MVIIENDTDQLCINDKSIFNYKINISITNFLDECGYDISKEDAIEIIAHLQKEFNL